MFKRTSIGVAACLALSCAPAANAHIVDNVLERSADDAAVKLSPIGSYEAGVMGKSAAEIVAYHAASQRILTVNAQSGKVDILDASDPANPTKVAEVSAGGDKEINSVAVRPDGLAIAAVQQADKTENGEALIFDASSGNELGRVPLGALPDNVHITKDGAYALTANEGEPSDELTTDGTEYAKDPEGTVSVISLPDGVQAPPLRMSAPLISAPSTAQMQNSTRPFASLAQKTTTISLRSTSSRSIFLPPMARPMSPCKKITPSAWSISPPPL